MTHTTTDQGHPMKTPSTLRLLVTIAVLTLSLGVMGCDSNKAQLNGLNNGADTGSASNNNNGVGDDAGSGGGDVTVGPTDDEGHGTAPGEEEHIEPGFMNGSWRAATTADDTPVAYFDTFEDKGDPSVTGTFLMGLGVYERLDGQSGDLEQSTFDGSKLTLKWNPTNDAEEVFILDATKTDANTFTGTVTATRNTDLNLAVTLTRHQDQ